MSNLKVLFWLEFLNTVQGCFQILYYSPFCERVFKGIKDCFICLCKWVVGRGDVLMAEHGYPSTQVSPREPDQRESMWLKVPSQSVFLSHIHSVSFRISHPWNILLSLNSGSTQHLEGVFKKSNCVSVQWRTLSRIWNKIRFHSEIFFVFSPHPSSPKTSWLLLERGVTEGMDSDVDCELLWPTWGFLSCCWRRASAPLLLSSPSGSSWWTHMPPWGRVLLLVSCLVGCPLLEDKAHCFLISSLCSAFVELN